MTTKELIKWANKAQDARERSWLEPQACYTLSIRQASEHTKPRTASEVEGDIVTCLNFNCWNEVQEWAKAFEAVG